jgi:hypothetical protein
MLTKKILWYFVLAVLTPLACFKVRAQTLDEKTYQHKMRLVDSLSIYKMRDFDTLYKVSLKDDVENYTEDFYGWVRTRNKKGTGLLTVTGRNLELEKKLITAIKPLPLDEETVDTVKSWVQKEGLSGIDDLANDNLLILWLYEKGKEDYSKRLLSKKHVDWLFSDEGLRDGFGVLYYDAMLSAYAKQRNYIKAIMFGEHLSSNTFSGFQDQKAAVALTSQLRTETGDFKSFRLPDSVKWLKLKQKLSREQQIIYLADRLRLLNCILFSNPGSINYKMDQYSISSDEAEKSGFPYWHHYAINKVINPFSELAHMKLSPHETELLLPYLMSDTYIPSLEYERLHKLSWVIESLLFEITGKRFLNQLYFDKLTPEEKKVEIEKIKKWCDENAGLPTVRSL